jgi:hypothetical protein
VLVQDMWTESLLQFPCRATCHSISSHLQWAAKLPELVMHMPKTTVGMKTWLRVTFVGELEEVAVPAANLGAGAQGQVRRVTSYDRRPAARKARKPSELRCC